MFCVKLHHCLNIIVAMCLVLPLLYGIQNNLNKPEILIQQAVLASSLIHSSINFIFHMINHHHIQNVISEMVHYSGLMKPHEEVLIRRYIDKCVVFYGGSIFIFYFVIFCTMMLSLVTDQTFRALAEYPFDVFHEPLKTIIYIQQSSTRILVAGQLCTNIFMALLLWYASARFELVAEELGKAVNIRYATKVTLITRPFAFSSICCSTPSLIATFFLLVTNLLLIFSYFTTLRVLMDNN